MDILKLVSDFETEKLPRLKKLWRYYRGEHDVLRTVKAEGKPNFKLVNNYAKNIVSNTVGYYLGKPITYMSEDEDLLGKIRKICVLNDDAFHNSSLATDLSIYGIAYELVYIDERKNIRYAKLDPLSTFVKYSDSLNRPIEYAVRFFDSEDGDGNAVRHIEVYTKDEIRRYACDGSLRHERTERHYFGQVPVCVYENNSELQGDFEDVISLIDAYNTMQSESVNDFNLFADAYLALVNMMGTDESDIEKLRRDRVLLLDENGRAEWLVKQVNDVHIENIKNRLNNDIYIFSNTVNMNDENFSGNLSGIAIKYKLMGMENRVSITERYFTRALQRRLSLICTVLNLMGGNYDYTDIKIVFSRNIPNNVAEIADIVNTLKEIVSSETLLAQLPFIDDVGLEMKKIAAEKGKKEHE